MSRLCTLPQMAAGLGLLALIATGCARSERAEALTDAAPSTPPAIAHPPPASGAAVSGVVTSSSYRLSFSLGGAISPMKSESYATNHRGTK